MGVRSVKKMFRAGSLAGLIMDAVLDLRGEGVLDEDYFTNAAYITRAGVARLSNESLGHFLTVDTESLIFTKDYYETEKHFSFDDFLKEFRVISEAANSVLKMRDIRRIGYVTEHRFAPKKEPSADLVKALTKMKFDGHADKFMLTFESRSLANGKKPDPKTGDFVNIIRQIYDSQHDADHPVEGYFNVNLDVQRYYAPVFNGRISDELLKLHNKEYAKACKEYFEELKALGLGDGETTD